MEGRPTWERQFIYLLRLARQARTTAPTTALEDTLTVMLPGVQNIVAIIVSSLRLEHQEGFVVAVKQVEEKHPRCLVGDGWGERLASDHVPSRGFIFKVRVGAELRLNFTCQFFVEPALGGRDLANYSKTRKAVG